MGSAALRALFGVWHTQSELHAINVLCSVFLPSLANNCCVGGYTEMGWEGGASSGLLNGGSGNGYLTTSVA